MKRSEFLRAAEDNFGARAGWVLADLILPGIGTSAQDALDAGVPARQIWEALCDETDLPATARYGQGVKPPTH